MGSEKTTSIRAADAAILPLSPAEVWPVLAAVARYPLWWPWFLFTRVLRETSELLGTELKICPYGVRSFRCQVESFEEPRQICMRYDGVFLEGVGVWRLEPAGQGTRVIYDLDVKAKGWPVAVLGAIINLHSIHAFSMRGIYRNLRRELFPQ